MKITIEKRINFNKIERKYLTYPSTSFSLPSTDIRLLFISNDPILKNTRLCIFVKVGITQIHWFEPLNSLHPI